MAVADAGLGDDVTPHTLRHTAATWLMMENADLWEAAGYLGMTVETLQRVDGYFRPEHNSGVRKIIGRRKVRSANESANRDRTATDQMSDFVGGRGRSR